MCTRLEVYVKMFSRQVQVHRDYANFQLKSWGNKLFMLLQIV